MKMIWLLPAGYPRKGWVYIGCEDLGEDGANCDACGTWYRFQHTVEHAEVDVPITVGCVCAEHLTEDYVNPEQREKNLKNERSREKRRAKRAAEEQRQSELHRQRRAELDRQLAEDKAEAESQAKRHLEENPLSQWRQIKSGNYILGTPANLIFKKSDGRWGIKLQDKFLPVVFPQADAAARYHLQIPK